MSPDIYSLLLHTHSIGRWIVLLLLLIAIFNSLVAGQRPWIRTDARTGSILTIFADIMFLVGLALWYFGSRGYQEIKVRGMKGVMENDTVRFFAIEHITLMLIAIILIHIGKVQGKKAISDRAKHKRTLIFYVLALILILAAIPWPFRAATASSHWF
jgi:hypothetical protein